VTQRDALGHVTGYEYDGVGRRVATVLPLGQRSTTAYDAAGNVYLVRLLTNSGYGVQALCPDTALYAPRGSLRTAQGAPVECVGALPSSPTLAPSTTALAPTTTVPAPSTTLPPATTVAPATTVPPATTAG
jgi:YD repeat-containing protein